jgi:hypothetical protein
MHKSGEWIEDTLVLPLSKRDPQAAGSAITYARRYSLQAIAGVPSADDDGEFAMDRVTNKKPQYMELQKHLTTMIEKVAMGETTAEQIIYDLEQRYTVDDKVKARIMEISCG